jgi:Cu/Ag efflux pump CusA
MARITALASRELRALPGVRNVSGQVGRAITSDKRANINAGELRISIDPGADYDATVEAVKRVVAGYPGLSPELLTYLQAQVRQELSGTGNSLVVRVYGEDLNMIRKKAGEVEKVLASTSGVVDAKVLDTTEMPSVEIEVNIERAKRGGQSLRGTEGLRSHGVGGARGAEQRVQNQRASDRHARGRSRAPEGRG